MEFFLNLLRSVAYGIIEGVTEWLPISSTGHMILAEQVLKFSFSAEFMEMFRVVIQLGAILAVVVLYFKKLWPFCADNGRDSGFSRHFRWPVVRLWCKIIVACVPAEMSKLPFLYTIGLPLRATTAASMVTSAPSISIFPGVLILNAAMPQTLPVIVTLPPVNTAEPFSV